MRIVINGDNAERLSALDRGLLYGHTVFETIAVIEGQPRLLEQHLERLALGADRLAIPLDKASLKNEIDNFCANLELACLRVTLSIGHGGRGYQSPESPKALRILSEHAYPDYPKTYWSKGIEIGVSEFRLAQQTHLAGIKHGNRLEQILARQQWQSHWQEALMLDTKDSVIEATSANVFVVADEKLITPSIAHCGVAGVMRAEVLRIAGQLGISTATVSLSLHQVIEADAIFLTNSLIGIWPVAKLQDQTFNDHNLAHQILNHLYQNEVIPNH